MSIFWAKLKNILQLNKKNIQDQPRCENCYIFFLEDKGQIIHINNKNIEVYSSQNPSIPESTIQLKSPGAFQKQILFGKYISGNLIAIILIDLRMFIINYKQGTIVKSIRNVNQITLLNDKSLLLFGTNQIRSFCQRTFKVINQVSTQFSSPVFTVDVYRNLFVVGSYWDIFLFDNQLQMKYSGYRAHNMNVLCVKFVNSQTIASTSEDYQLILWQIVTTIESGQEIYTLVKKMNLHLSYINASNILVCPFNKFSLLINSNTSVRYIVFNQQLNGETPIQYETLRQKSYNVQMDRMFETEKQFSIKQLKVDLQNNQIVATFKDSCSLFSSNFNKKMFDNLAIH